MIVVICDATIAPEKQTAYVEKINASGVIAKTNAEQGCISYELSSIAGAPGKMYVTERWESMDALQAHIAGPVIAEFRSIGAEFGFELTAAIYEAEKVN